MSRIRSFSRAATCALACALVMAASSFAAGPLALGSAMPAADVAMKNVDGKDLTLGAVKGTKGTLVVFTCNACPFAKAWEKRIAELGNDYLGQGIGVVAINSNDPSVVPGDSFDEMKSRASSVGFKFPYVVDATSGVARAFTAARTPEAFLFGKDGTLVYHGTIDDNAQDAADVKNHYLKDALDAVAKGQDVAVKETKAIGCGIKFHS